MRSLTVILTGLVMILVMANSPAGEPPGMVPVSLNNVNDSSSPQNISQYSYCPDWIRSWLFYKSGQHSFRSGIMSARHMQTYYKGPFDSAKRIKFGTIVINAILDYDDYTHIDMFFENKE